MLKVRWTFAFMVLGFLVAMPSFAETPLDRMMAKGDHAGLEQYYAKEAKEFKTKATHWEFLADYYSEHPDQAGDKPNEHIAHLRGVAKELLQSAHEAQDLAATHRAMKARKGVGP
jgi:hypothetical protein